MYVKKITAVLLLLFLTPYLISSFFSSDRIPISQNKNFAEDTGSIVIEIKEGAGIRRIPLENYILGVLPEVIPITYESEALKAQAVLLRTQLIWEYEEKGSIQEKEGASWLSEERMKTLWGESFESNYGKLTQAVNDTRGLYLSYDGRPILASYFRVSAGNTRNAAEAFGNGAYPYLCRAECERDCTAEDYLFQKEIETSEFCGKLNIRKEELSSMKLAVDTAGYCTLVSFDGQSVQAEDKTVLNGEQFRTLFELPSSCFEIKIERNKVHITVKGIGHGLGMSQFAANEMAKTGADFMTILSYFFTDIAFDKFE